MFEGKLGKEMMIEQGYVPSTCTLPEDLAGLLIWDYIKANDDPCRGCNMDRLVCKGRTQQCKE